MGWSSSSKKNNVRSFYQRIYLPCDAKAAFLFYNCLKPVKPIQRQRPSANTSHIVLYPVPPSFTHNIRQDVIPLGRQHPQLFIVLLDYFLVFCYFAILLLQRFDFCFCIPVIIGFYPRFSAGSCCLNAAAVTTPSVLDNSVDGMKKLFASTSA